MRDLADALRRYISHWAFLRLSQFSNSDSLKVLRPDFGFVSKTAMMVDALRDGDVVFDDDDMNRLDTVDDFVGYLHGKGVSRVNVPPQGYC